MMITYLEWFGTIIVTILGLVFIAIMIYAVTEVVKGNKDE